MTAKTNQQALDRLADVLVDDILNTPADQLLVEVAEDYGDPRALAAAFDRIALRARSSKDRLVTSAAPISANEALGRLRSASRSHAAGMLKHLRQNVIPSIFDVIFPNRLAMIAASSACVASLAFIIAAPTVFDWIQSRSPSPPAGTEVFDGAPTGPQIRAPVRELEVANEPSAMRGLPSDAPPSSPSVPRVLDLPSGTGETGKRSAAAADGGDGSKSGSSIAPSVPPRIAPASVPAAESYVVQVSLERRKADAQASLRNLQAKIPKELGDHKATVRRADLGPNGLYYRAVVGPFGSAADADRFCLSLKAAGGQCTVQKD
jgi:hypothetical protein